MSSQDHDTGEEIHLPGPSAQPFLVTIGITLLLIGVTFHIALVVAGAALTLWQSAKWIADCRNEVNELPLEH